RRILHMTGLPGNGLLQWILGMYGLLLVSGPVLLRQKFRWRAQLDPQAVRLEDLPAEVRNYMSERIPQIQALGFEPIAHVKLGEMTTNTSGYMALLANAKTREWADVSVITSVAAVGAGGATGTRTVREYIEFIAYCSNTLQLDTNTAPIAPVLFP